MNTNIDRIKHKAVNDGEGYMMSKRERERQRKERAERAKELTRLNALRCDNCKEGTPVNRGLQCECDAAVQIRAIGKQMDGNQPKGEQTDEVLTVELYVRLKSEGKTDKEIGYSVGRSKNQMHYFKSKHGLLGDHVYGDTKIAGLLREQGELSESSEMLKVSYDAEQKERELSHLRHIEGDYQKLEVDYRNERTENERLRNIIEDMKSTYQMNLWLMEQHIMLNKRVGEMME